MQPRPVLSTHPCKSHDSLAITIDGKSFDWMRIHRLMFDHESQKVKHIWVRCLDGLNRKKAADAAVQLMTHIGKEKSDVIWKVHAQKTIDAVRFVSDYPAGERVFHSELKEHFFYKNYPDCTREVIAEQPRPVWLVARLSLHNGGISLHFKDNQANCDWESVKKVQPTERVYIRLFDGEGLTMKRTTKNDESSLEAWVHNVSGREAFFEVKDDRFRPIEFQYWCPVDQSSWCERIDDNNIARLLKGKHQPVWLRALEAAARYDMMLLDRAEQLLRSVDEPASRMFEELMIKRVRAKDQNLQDDFLRAAKDNQKKKKHVGHDHFERFDKTFDSACLELINDSLADNEKIDQMKDRRGTIQERDQSVDDIGEVEPFQTRRASVRQQAPNSKEYKQGLFDLLVHTSAAAADMNYTIRKCKTEHNTSFGWILHQSRNALAHNPLGCRAINLVPLWAELLTGGDMVDFNEFLGSQVKVMRGIVHDYLEPPK